MGKNVKNALLGAVHDGDHKASCCKKIVFFGHGQPGYR